jgi:U3 small nucleolar RNA-associated protein 20
MTLMRGNYGCMSTSLWMMKGKNFIICFRDGHIFALPSPLTQLSVCLSSVGASGSIDRRIVQRRLTSILQAFASVKGPQQLYKHQLLLSIFVSLIGHQETTIAQLAFSCVLRYKPDHIVPYADPLQSFFGKGKLREAMLQFSTLSESGAITPEHRVLLMPVVSRLLFGRLSARGSGAAKSSKDTPAARRTAVLSFLAGLCKSDDDLYSFIYLTVRSYMPLEVPMKAVELHDSEDRRKLHEIIAAVRPEHCARLPIQVHQGFLNMLEALISQLGHRVLSFVPSFMSSVMALYKLYGVKVDDGASAREEGADEDGGDGNAVDGGSRSGSVRTLCYRRMADLFSQFSAVFDFRVYAAQLWDAVRPSLELLPEMVVKSDKSPSLLLLLQTLSSNSQLVPILEESDEAIRAVLMCISSTSRGAVIDSALSFVDNLLVGDLESLEGTDVPESQSNIGGEIIRKHLGLLLGQLKLRLDSTCSSLAASRPVGSWKKDPAASFTWRRELDILCRVSTLIDAGNLGGQQVEVEVMESLCSMLIPFLEEWKCTDTDRLNILGVLDAMIPKLPSATLVSFYSKLSSLLGPKKAKAGLNSKEVRLLLASVFETLSSTGYPSSGRATGILMELSAVEANRVDEVDYDSVVPALSKLGDSNSSEHWLGICQDEGESEPTILLPLIHSLFNFLFDEDGVISRGAFKAIKDLIGLAAAQFGLGPEMSHDTVLDPTQEKWRRLLEGCIVPMTRSGLSSRDAAIRRYFILILGEVARWTKYSDSPHLYGDLAHLIRDDDPDLDFFLNITHVQLHRRSRALQRLRTQLIAESEQSIEARFSQHSLSKVLLPLALHPVYESKTKLEEAFALEAIATVGAISRLLPWSKFNSILWTTLTQFDRHPTQERYLIGLISAIIDGFHFEVSIPSDEGVSTDNGGSNSVWRALENRLIPKVESLLVKEKSDRGGSKVKILRPPVIMALLKLYKKLPEHIFVSRLPRLLAVICDGLKNRDSDARDMARTTLAKMAVELDIAFLADIVRELAVTLTEGYQLHVRAAAIHSILLQLSAVYKPPVLSNEEGGGAPLRPFDKTVPALMDLIQQDLFGVAQERKEAENNVRYVKEAGGAKSSHSIEIISSMILFNPSKVGGKGVSAIHAIVSPLLERLRFPGTQAKVIRRIKESLSCVVKGLFRNPSLHADEVLPFVYATVEPFVSKQEVDSVVDRAVDPLDSDGEDSFDPIDVSGGAQKAPIDGDAKKRVPGTVTEWRPSTLQSSKTKKAAHLAKSKAERETKIAKDGASAPKLTGSSRYTSPKVSAKIGVNDPANISAVVFGLQLLQSSLKKLGHGDSENMVAMLDPFVPLLTTCTCLCRDSDVVLLALRCLGSLLRVELPSFSLCSKSLATKTLDVLASSGAVSNINQELLHASFKMLTFLINFDLRHQDGNKMAGETAAAGEHVMAKGNVIPLDAEQMQVLISFLRGSLTDSDHHNPAIGLIKALAYRRFMSPEFYDLLETILDQSVRSPRESLRQVRCYEWARNDPLFDGY